MLVPNISLVIYKGKGVTQDYTEAAKWIEQAAAQEHIKAQYQLAQMHIHGQGVPKDFAKAAQLYRLAANQGHQKAQFQLGLLYKKGQGVAQDYQEATKWLKKSLQDIQ